MNKASINVQKVKPTSERHNRREMDLDYVRQDLTDKNESWELETISSRVEDVRARYEKSVKQKMQEKASPIREAVFLLKPDTTMEDCKNLAKAIEDRFGINTFQIHLHRDEGHFNHENEWKPNLHGHLVMDWTDQKTGKAIKLNRHDLAELQTITANILGMERGKNSDKKHLTALQYKNKVQEEMKMQLEAELSDLRALHEKVIEQDRMFSEKLNEGLKKIRRASKLNQIELRKVRDEIIKEAERKRLKWMSEADEKLNKINAILNQEPKKEMDREPKKDLPEKRGGISM